MNIKLIFYMGVPGIYLWLKKKKSDFISNVLSLSPDYLMLDLNCKIHPTCFKIKHENSELICVKQLEELQINEIIKDIIILIKLINPKIGVYIAVDGVAPAAKMKQQRFRRFKSVSDNKLWDNIKKKHNKPNSNLFWNNSAITPGTKFMDKLHNTILNFISTNNLNINIIYSSCYSPSEGEHKLLQYIKSNLEYSYVIYGLDADLIFLSLSSQSNNIHLLRESNEIDSKNNDSKSQNEFTYVNIELMKNYIYDIIQNKISYILEKKNVINDFIFICYFLGNDFIPHINSIDIYDNKYGIDYLLNIYIKVIQNLSYQYLINLENDIKINMLFFTEFIKLLSIDEEYILKNIYYSNSKKIKNINDPYEKEIHKIENLLFKINDPIKLGLDSSSSYINPKSNILTPGWRERYYKHYWDIDTDELEDFSKKLVENYLIGLKWITLYYFDKNPSWDWYFPFDFPPFISDIFKYNIDLNNIKFDLGEPVTPFIQLLTILPPQSNYLLPPNIRKILINPKSTLSYLYPIDFDQCFINKKKHWMGIPILPPMDIELVKYIFYKYKDELTSEDLIRNKLII